jgi:ricin-type beta-trefoil lectin protein
MTPQDSNGPRLDAPEDGDPLLVRPFLLGEQDPSDTVVTWPSAEPPAEPWPSASLSGTREILSHRADKRTPPPGEAAPTRHRRALVLAGVGAVAVLGLAAAGYGMLQPAPGDDDVPIPSGALPPVESVAPGSPAAAPVPTAPGGGAAPTTGRTPGKASSPTVAPTSPAAGATTTPAPVAGATKSIVPEQPGLVALSPAPVAARVGTIAGDGNLCLDLNGGAPVDDNHVQVYACNGGVAQRWTLATDGTLQVVGKCAQVTADSTVHIIGCDGRAAAQWRVAAGNSLVNVATGQCLTDPESGARSGAGVRVSPCAATGNQRWTLP